MPSLVKKMISRFNPPDIRKFYKIHREIVHFMVRSAVKVNDGHFDKYVTAPDGHNIRVRIYPPRRIGSSTRLLVFFHGGGWVIDDIDRYHKVCRQLAEITGSYVLSVDYRLAPEHKYPAGLDDCYEVTRQVFASAARYGIKKRNIILIGDSAGGNLALELCRNLDVVADMLPVGMMLVYPVVDNRSDGASLAEFTDMPLWNSVNNAKMWRWYLDGQAYVSPVDTADKYAYLRHAFVETEEFDCLCEQGTDMYEALKKHIADVTLLDNKGTFHGFDVNKNADVVCRSFNARVDFLQKCFNCD